jgi:hypothetical protein
MLKRQGFPACVPQLQAYTGSQPITNVAVFVLHNRREKRMNKSWPSSDTAALATPQLCWIPAAATATHAEHSSHSNTCLVLLVKINK